MNPNEENLTLSSSPQEKPVESDNIPTTKADAKEAKEREFLSHYSQEKKSGISYREFRHEHWNDNKALYDDVVPYNRLTQRQPVNIPIMRETINTLLTKIDDPQEIRWENKDQGPVAKDKEIVISEMWDDAARTNNFEIVDYLAKKSVMLYGRAIKKHTITEVIDEKGSKNREYRVGVLDVFDFLIDPRTSPANIQTARFMTHTNIKRRLSEILASKEYSEDAKRKLIVYLDNPEGLETTHGAVLEKIEPNETWAAKQERLRNLNITDFGSFAGADVEIDLDEHYNELWDPKKNQYIRHVGLVANGNILLQLRLLQDAIGIINWPFTSWNDDPDALLYWSLGIADMIRTPNKVLNIFFSQMLENRTLRNYGMMWYDPSDPEFVPSTYNPEPFGLYPAPKVFQDDGKSTKPIQQVLMPIQVPALEESLTDMQFIISMVERATAATAIEKGVSQQGQQTLGEIEALLAESQKRTISSAKFYRREWEESAQMFYDLMFGSVMSDQRITYHKKNSKGEYIAKEVTRQQWESKRGYKIIATSATEQDTKNTQKIKGLLAAQKVYPNNLALNKVLQRRLLQYADVTGDEMKEIQDFEEKSQNAPPITPATPATEQVNQANQMIGMGREAQRAMAEMP